MAQVVLEVTNGSFGHTGSSGESTIVCFRLTTAVARQAEASRERANRHDAIVADGWRAAHHGPWAPVATREDECSLGAAQASWRGGTSASFESSAMAGGATTAQS